MTDIDSAKARAASPDAGKTEGETGMTDICITNLNISEFTKQWVDGTYGLSAEQCASRAWNIMNDAWSRGYAQGKDDPYFDREDDTTSPKQAGETG